MNQAEQLGTHILLNICDADPVLLDSMDEFVSFSEGLLYDHGCHLIDYQKHKFTPQGFTAVFMLSESHLSIHTWPEKGVAACDIFTCGIVNTAAIAQEIIRWFSPNEYSMRKISR
jgi:S-adenosylmethionine decarboxylase proenzyme